MHSWLLIRVQIGYSICFNNCLRCLCSKWFSNCKMRHYTCNLQPENHRHDMAKTCLFFRSLEICCLSFAKLSRSWEVLRTPLSVEFEEWPSFALFFNVCFMIVDIFCLFFCLFLSLVTRIIRPTSQCFFLRLLNCSTSYWFCWKITLMFVCADRSNPWVATFNLIWKLARMFHLI